MVTAGEPLRGTPCVVGAESTIPRWSSAVSRALVDLAGRRIDLVIVRVSSAIPEAYVAEWWATPQSTIHC